MRPHDATLSEALRHFALARPMLALLKGPRRDWAFAVGLLVLLGLAILSLASVANKPLVAAATAMAWFLVAICVIVWWGVSLGMGLRLGRTVRQERASWERLNIGIDIFRAAREVLESMKEIERQTHECMMRMNEIERQTREHIMEFERRLRLREKESGHQDPPERG